MYYYSFQPMMDKSDWHIGFYIVCFLASVVIIYSIIEMFKREIVDGLFGLVVAFGITSLVHHYSYVEDHPENVQVVAKFTGYSHEEHTEQNGKYKTVTNLTYAHFKTPDGNVALKTDPSRPMPDSVILYGNKKNCGCT